jgi:hypothetical protein
MSLAPSYPTDRRPRAKDEPRDAELNQTASREPETLGQIKNVWPS